MIEKESFLIWWERLCQRFQRPIHADEARAYLLFLRSRMTTEEFEWAAEVVWATREFFPRPIDFLLVAPMGEWPRVLEMSLGGGYDDGGWAALTDRTRRALRMVGGSEAVRRDAQRARRAFEAALLDDVAQEAGTRLGVLPAPEGEQVSLGSSRQSHPVGAAPKAVSPVLRFPTSESFDPQ